MKKIVILSCLACLSCNLHRDSDTLSKISDLPSFNILLLDSTTLLNTSQIPKGNPVLVVYFRPDCPHCNRETKDFINHMDSLKDFRIYFLAGATLSDIKSFAQQYQLQQYHNITVGKDHEHSFVRVFRPNTIPYIAIYNAEKKLLKIYDEEISVGKIIKLLRG